MKLSSYSFLGWIAIGLDSVNSKPLKLGRCNQKKAQKVIPPGGGSDALWSRSPELTRLTACILVGSEEDRIRFDFVSTVGDVVLGNFSTYNYNPQTSPSFASAHSNSSLILYDNYLAGYNLTGEVAYEYFGFLDGEMTTTGQKFIYDYDVPSNTLLHPVLGFGFGSKVGASNFVQYLHQQAWLNHTILAFALNMTGPLETFDSYGEYFLGAINSSLLASPLVNYSRTVDTASWSMYLSDIVVGKLGGGFNGYVTWDTSSTYNIVPVPVFYALLNMVNLTGISQVGAIENVLVANFSCSEANYPAAFPNITYYLNQEPLLLTPYQYVLNIQPDVCQFGFAGSSTYPPTKAAFTLGVIAMNTTMTVFDMDHGWVGVAPLVKGALWTST